MKEVLQIFNNLTSSWYNLLLNFQKTISMEDFSAHINTGRILMILGGSLVVLGGIILWLNTPKQKAYLEAKISNSYEDGKSKRFDQALEFLLDANMQNVGINNIIELCGSKPTIEQQDLLIGFFEEKLPALDNQKNVFIKLSQIFWLDLDNSKYKEFIANLYQGKYEYHNDQINNISEILIPNYFVKTIDLDYRDTVFSILDKGNYIKPREDLTHGFYHLSKILQLLQVRAEVHKKIVTDSQLITKMKELNLIHEFIVTYGATLENGNWNVYPELGKKGESLIIDAIIEEENNLKKK